MGAIAETFAQLDKLEEENRKLKVALDKAVKFAAERCERCPCDEEKGCTRYKYSQEPDCEGAVKNYFFGKRAANVYY